MSKQDEDKAREIANQSPVYFMHIYNGCFEMAAWKEQQMIEKACYWFEKNWTMYTYPSHLMFEDFKKYMEEN